MVLMKLNLAGFHLFTMEGIKKIPNYIADENDGVNRDFSGRTI